MKKNKLYKNILALSIVFSAFSLQAQQVNTMYFMENMPLRHYLNPAFQPLSGSYLSFPVIGYSQFGLGTNSFSLKDFVYSQNGQTISAFAPSGDKNKFFNALHSTTFLNSDMQFNLLGFGFRTKKSYWSFSLSAKVDAEAGIPKDLMKLMLFGTPKMYDNQFDLTSLGADATTYLEAALGYSKNINSEWNYGFKVKFLSGIANVSGVNDQLNLTAGADKWTLKGEGTLRTSSAAITKVENNLKSVDINSPESSSDWAKPAGTGFGADLGVTYSPMKNLTFSGAITDLGFIRWNKNVQNVKYNVDYTFDGVKVDDVEHIDESAITDSLQTALQNATPTKITSDSYTTYITSKLNLGGEYAFLKNKMSVGLLSRTMFHHKKVLEELTASVNFHPIDWFNISTSYSAVNGRFSNIGAGLGLRTGIIHWFLAADYIPFEYAKSNSLRVPYNTKGINLALGINFVFGNKKDSDKDGVSDRKDDCANTPFGVLVDKKGCPIDTDGDGVPDYLDKCPGTPKAADQKVDSKGCLLDTDGDGVPDYLDKCPGTPKEAKKLVDSFGCLLDTDKDGVYDYLDTCPETPTGVKVDSVGCPLDADGDGVPDYLDLCPNTPVEARGKIDSKGCPIDSDNDGVPDYLDLCDVLPTKTANLVDINGCLLDDDKDGVTDNLDECPNTPKEAKGFVDAKGCPLDTDKDGVFDYLDKSPNTPVGVPVDASGCPFDYDKDGVYDYLDKCPKVPGLASNNGCPEVSKVAKQLFHKALQGIQFNPANAEIKNNSYVILNQIAKVLIDNPTYIIEIAGHTDNIGSADKNLILSQERTASVREYLIKRGVDPKRMTSVGYGETKPIGDNKTAKGRTKNRRVEFIVTFEEVSF